MTNRARRFLLVGLSLAVLSRADTSARAGPVPESSWKTIDSIINKELPSLLAIHREFHEHPELSHNEKWTSARYAKEFRALGYQVTENLGGYGVVAVLKNGKGPVTLVRADMDALPIQEATGLSFSSKKPGVMHACGHDVHMTNAIGTARVLKEMKSEWKGTLIIIGQPAEERGTGANLMLKAGLRKKFPKYDTALALHIDDSLEAGALSYADGFILASVDSVDITMRGKGGHGAAPHLGVDPVVMTAQLVMALQTIVSRSIEPVKDAVVTVGSIHGGSKHNIIPDEVKLQLTLRTYEPEVRALMIKRIKELSFGIAAAHNAPKPTVKLADANTPSLYNDPKLGAELQPVLKRAAVGRKVQKGKKAMYGEDFSFYSLGQKVPTAFWGLGVMPKDKKKHGYAHSATFRSETKVALPAGIRAMAGAVLYLNGRQ